VLRDRINYGVEKKGGKKVEGVEMGIYKIGGVG